MIQGFFDIANVSNLIWLYFFKLLGFKLVSKWTKVDQN